MKTIFAYSVRGTGSTGHRPGGPGGDGTARASGSRRRAGATTAALVSAAVASVTGCMGGATPDPMTPDGSTMNPPTDGGARPDAMTPPPPPPSGGIRVRVAHLSPNAPAVDVCVRARGAASFGVPVLRGLGVTAGLAYGQVTGYLDLPAGAYEVRLVAPNSADCATPLAGLPNFELPALDAGTSVTAAATGVVGGSVPGANFAITPFVDDPTPPAAGDYKLRFAHAAPGVPAVDVGVLDPVTNTLTTLFAAVAYGHQHDGERRYVTGAAVPAPGVTLAARATGSNPAPGAYPLRLDGVVLPAGANLSVFAVGRLNDNDTPLSALVCNDAMVTNNLTQCVLLPERAQVRVAHLSPNAPAVDFCLKRTGAGDETYQGPVLRAAGRAQGLAFPAVTGYFAVAPGAYTARLVAAGSASCATSLAGLPAYDLPALTGGQWATAAAIGMVGSAPGFTVRPYLDTHDAPPAGRANLRFIHASPGTPNVDVGTAGAAFAPIWSNVAFGAAGRAMTATDANGFLTTAPLSDATIAVRPSGSMSDALLLRGVNAPAGAVLSLFAIGTLSGPESLSTFICHDRVPAMMNVAVCSRVR